jgi:short-subunit dehydrogenase
MDLRKKVAVVTGASGGIGSALVKKLVALGVRVIALDASISLLNQLKSTPELLDITTFACDFTDAVKVQETANLIKEQFNEIDFLFNVAGVGIYKKLDELTFGEWKSASAINLDAPFIFSKTLLASLNNAKKGMIFNMGSGMGVIPAANRSAYCSTKYALRGLSLSLNKELQSKNIDVVLLTLGSVMTSFGTGGIDARKELARNGKKYLKVGEVIDKIVAITESENREAEYVLYPEGYA